MNNVDTKKCTQRFAGKLIVYHKVEKTEEEMEGKYLVGTWKGTFFYDGIWRGTNPVLCTIVGFGVCICGSAQRSDVAAFLLNVCKRLHSDADVHPRTTPL